MYGVECRDSLERNLKDCTQFACDRPLTESGEELRLPILGSAIGLRSVDLPIAGAGEKVNRRDRRTRGACYSPLADAVDPLGVSLILPNRATYRGSPRSGSMNGYSWMGTIMRSLTSTARSSHTKAFSTSPRPR